MFLNLDKAPQEQLIVTIVGKMYSQKRQGNVHFLDSNDEINIKDMLYMPKLK